MVLKGHTLLISGWLCWVYLVYKLILIALLCLVILPKVSARAAPQQCLSLPPARRSAKQAKTDRLQFRAASRACSPQPDLFFPPSSSLSRALPVCFTPTFPCLLTSPICSRCSATFCFSFLLAEAQGDTEKQSPVYVYICRTYYSPKP